MNSKLLKKCDKLIANANEKTILYEDLLNEINKDKYLASYSTTIPNALDYLRDAGIEIVMPDDVEKPTKKAVKKTVKKKSTKSKATKPKAEPKTKLIDIIDEDELIEDEIIGDAFRLEEAEENTDEIDKIYTTHSLDGTSIYMNNIAEIQGNILLSHEEEVELCKAAQNGDIAARNKVIESNLKLVIYVAKKYKPVVTNMDFDDLIQAGNIGLMKAVEKFDVNHGTKFSTYAVYWIKQSILRTIGNDERTVRVPIHMLEQSRKNAAAREKLTEMLDRKPTDEELSDYINEHNLLSTSVKEMTPEIVRLIDSNNVPHVSMDYPIYNDGDHDPTYFGDFIASSLPGPEELAVKQDMAKMLHDVVKEVILKPRYKVNKVMQQRQYEILCRRFGLNGHERETLQEIATDFGLSRERIRQLEDSAIKRIRCNPKALAKLRPFLENLD